MSNNKLIKTISSLLKKSIETNFEGCLYSDLGNGLALVASQQEEGVFAKIAYNCDDLQCDYNWDWQMPVYKDGEICFTETLVQKGKITKLTDWFLKCYKEMISEIVTGDLLLDFYSKGGTL